MRCPECKEEQYYVCSNKDCKCWPSVPEGRLVQIPLEIDGLACPYCGFSAHMDFWEELAMLDAEKSR